MYLMDGEQQIMISDALNESDRLSSCSKRVRKAIAGVESPFNVYAFQTLNDADAGRKPGRFHPEIQLERNSHQPGCVSTAAAGNFSRAVPAWICRRCGEAKPSSCSAAWCRSATISSRKSWCAPAAFHKLIRRNFRCSTGPEQPYYEVCSNPAIYAMLEGKSAKSSG